MTTPGPDKRRILLATDAWEPQINGVVRCYQYLIRELEAKGHEFRLIDPGLFRQIDNPLYREVRLALPKLSVIRKAIDEFRPDHIHIATEGPIGIAMRNHCVRRGLRFTTSFHTLWPDYMWNLARVPFPITWTFLRWFHRPSRAVLVPTLTMKAELAKRGIKRLGVFSRGVNLEQFKPYEKKLSYERPVMTYVGRVSFEKGVQDFLALKMAGTKVIVGDGPARSQLENQYPEAVFLGFKEGEELAHAYAESDVIVFPSKTDTFGQVILEGLACGVPVAAFPAPGPSDLLAVPGVGCVNADLKFAIETALATGDPVACQAHARKFMWSEVAHQFYQHLIPVRESKKSLQSAPIR